MNIIKRTSTTNTTYLKGRKILYLAIHYTAGVSSKSGSARSSASWFANPNAGGSADFIVDENEFVQFNPDPRNRYCHAVGGSRYNTKGGRLYGVAKNSNCISLEICSTNTTGKITYPNDPHYSFSDVVLNRAVEVTKYLMKEYGIDAAHVIRHYDVNGKPCPGIIGWNADSGNENKWKEFQKRIGGEVEEIKYKVRLTWDNEKSQKGAFVYYDKAVECANENPGYTVFTLDGKAKYTSKGLPSIEAVIANQSKSNSIALLSNLPDYKGLPSSKEDYLNKVAEIAVKLYSYTRILPSVVISQCCLENGFGTASDAIELTKRSNLVGQKADLINSTWQDQTVWDGTKFSKKTPEVYGGVPTTVTAAFRVFPNYAYSILDYELFLTHVKISANQYKYRDVVGMTDPQAMITKISQRGYATGTTYISSVMRIINQYNLTKYDKEAISMLSNSTPQNAQNSTQNPSKPTNQNNKSDAKQTTKTVFYRVQVGVFSTEKKRDSLVNSIKKKLDFDCFYEKNGNNYYVYCGSFKDKSIAEQRVKQLKAKGFDAFIKSVS